VEKKTTSFSRTLQRAASPRVIVVNEDVAGFAEQLRKEKA